MNKKKIISAGHVCLDITPVFPSARSYTDMGEILRPGRLIHMKGVYVHTGGSVANTGLALKKLGNDVIPLGKIGADAFGGMIRNIFAGYGVSGLIVDEGGTTSYSVVLAVPGIDRVILHDPGCNDTFVSADIPDRALEEAALFHFGYPPLMKKMYEGGGAELVELFRRVKKAGLASSLDFTTIDPDSGAGQVDWPALLEEVLPYVDFFVPSFEELCFMLDRPRYDRLAADGSDMTEGLDVEAEAAPLADRLLAMGCRAVLIKCGVSGMYYRTAERGALAAVGDRVPVDADAWADRRGVQPCFKADIVRSGIGAGDTSIAAYLTAVLAGKTPEACAALAAAEGACCVTGYDSLSGVRPLSELEARIRAGWETMPKRE